MQLILRRFIFTLFLFITVDSFSQKISPKDRQIIDSLKKKSYEFLYESQNKFEDDSTKVFVFAQAYLEKGKEEKDSLRVAHAYTQLNYITNAPYLRVSFGDSIIRYTKNINTKLYPTAGYLIKAISLYDLGSYKNAFDNYLIAKRCIDKNPNDEYLFIVKNQMANLKNILGLYEEALKDHKELYFITSKTKDNNNFSFIKYLITISNLSNSYTLNKKLDSADIYINLGIKESLKAKDTIEYYNFVTNSAYNEYFKGNYQVAIDSLNKSFPHETDQNTRINHYLYKGRIAKDLNKLEEAILNFEKLDSIYEIHKDPIRELPEVYQTFIDYYKEKGDIENQLKYIDKFIAVDSVLDANFNYLSTNITKEYDIPLLISDKENLIDRLEKEKNQSNLGLGILGIATLLLSGFLFYYIKKQRFYKKRFEEVLNTEPTTVSFLPPQESKKINDLSKDVVEKITKGLKEFEREKNFLDNTTTLNSLSKKLDTNSNYLSKVINSYEQKNFSNYLNNLRVEYAIEQLKTNSKFRMYSVKGMAKEVGFNSPESFSKAFHKRTGIYPSYFLRQLEKINK